MAMQKPPHLSYLSKPLEWYIGEHMERQTGISNSRCGPPARSIEQVLKRNKNREYKGLHAFCAAEEFGEILSCVIFKRTKKDLPTEYFHTLYLGKHTENLEKTHELILGALGISPDDYQKSLIASH